MLILHTAKPVLVSMNFQATLNHYFFTYVVVFSLMTQWWSEVAIAIDVSTSSLPVATSTLTTNLSLWPSLSDLTGKWSSKISTFSRYRYFIPSWKFAHGNLLIQ